MHSTGHNHHNSALHIGDTIIPDLNAAQGMTSGMAFVSLPKRICTVFLISILIPMVQISGM